MLPLRVPKKLIREIEKHAYIRGKSRNEFAGELLGKALFAELQKEESKPEPTENDVIIRLKNQIQRLSDKDLQRELHDTLVHGAYGYQNFVFSNINMLSAGASYYEITKAAMISAEQEARVSGRTFDDAFLEKQGTHREDVWKAKEVNKKDAGMFTEMMTTYESKREQN